MGGRLGGADDSRVLRWSVDPIRECWARVLEMVGSLGFGDGEADGSEVAVAVGFGAVEVLGEGTVEIETGAGEGGEGPCVAPIEGEEASCFSRGGTCDGGLLEEGDGGALLGEEVGGADSDDSAAANHHSFPLIVFHGRCW